MLSQTVIKEVEFVINTIKLNYIIFDYKTLLTIRLEHTIRLKKVSKVSLIVDLIILQNL